MLLETENVKKLVLIFSFMLLACTEQSILDSPRRAGTAEASPSSENPASGDPRDVFQTAIRLFDAGNGADAEPLFLSSTRNVPTIADYAFRYLAKIAEARGDSELALTRWKAIADQFPISPWRSEAALALGRARRAADDLVDAEHWLEEARREALTPAEEARALWSSSHVARERGNTEMARALAVELRTRHPASPEAREARDQAWSERGALESADTARNEISLLLSEGQPNRALELVREAERRWPRDVDLPALRLLEASALKRTGDVEGAIRILEDLRKRSPAHPAAIEALFRLASLAWNRDEDRKSLRLFDLYSRRHPRGEHAVESMYATARIQQEAGRYGDAARRFDRLARTYPQSSLAPEAAWRVGWCEYRAGHPRKAAMIFDRIARHSSDVRAAALYWKARSLENAGETAPEIYGELLREFPESYYGMLAERRTNRPEGSALTERAPFSRSAPTPASFRAASPQLARFDELRGMSLRSLARVELLALARKATNVEPLTLVQAWAAVDGYREAIQIAARQHLCTFESSFVSVCYPLAFWPAIRREATRHGVDPFLLLAMVRQESLFDVEAVSSANARGLMQLLPSTAARVARNIDRADFRPESLFDPEPNVALGAAYLHELLDRYRNNVDLTIAAYNAGESAVDKWQLRYASLKDDEFVESISYRETRSYVKRVLQNERIYRALYSQQISGDTGIGN